MARLDSIRWDLGLRKLLPEWKAFFSPRHLRDDFLAGLSVSLIAVPLSLAIALASGVPPALGLVTAIISGVIVGFMGGAPLSVTGPAAAMAVLVASLVQTHGLMGLIVVTLCAGFLQVITGVLGFGRVARLVPMPVIEGFTAGIGAIILIGQLPRALGLPPSPGPDVHEVLLHIQGLAGQIKPTAVVIALTTMAFVFLSPKLHKRIPGALLGVLVPTLGVAVLGIDTSLLGEVPNKLPLPKIPEGDFDFSTLLGPILVVFALASLESLLSAAAVDKLDKTSRHDPDQEFIGQGLGNMVVALFGGIPVTGVIARSALNVQAGAKTRRATIIHALLVLIGILAFSQGLERIPLAALSGLLLSIALRMLNPSHFVALWRMSRSDAMVYAVTFAVIVFFDLIQGVQWGVAAAVVVAAVFSTRAHVQLHRLEAGGIHRLTLEGPHTFLSALKYDAMHNEIALLPKGTAVVLDMARVPYVDATGAEAIVEIVDALVAKEMQVIVLGMSADVEARIRSCDKSGNVASRIAQSEAETSRFTGNGGSKSAGRLSVGLESFRRIQRPRYTQLFHQLSNGQTPHTLFVTCSDSRVVPSLMTASDPGELFIVRNVGNMIPVNTDVHAPTVTSAVEYAVGVLKVSDIVVCAHSRCGAIKAVRDPDALPPELKHLNQWLRSSPIHAMCSKLPSALSDDDVARMNALLQLDHLRTHPVVKAAEDAGQLSLHAWFFHVGTGEIEVYDPSDKGWRREKIEDSESEVHTNGAVHDSPPVVH